jgi:hypothetical protein
VSGTRFEVTHVCHQDTTDVESRTCVKRG